MAGYSGTPRWVLATGLVDVKIVIRTELR